MIDIEKVRQALHSLDFIKDICATDEDIDTYEPIIKNAIDELERLQAKGIPMKRLHIKMSDVLTYDYCPSCRHLLVRDYTRHCDYCGQRLEY